MDEATANIDPKTDNDIQLVLKKYFKESTIITIAHRLNTIIDYDRILVLKAGVLVEIGTPIELFKCKGEFYNLVNNQGKDLIDNIEEKIRAQKKN